jgi:dsDNA-specific endonuclease/ATPase MutS2
LVSKGGGEEEKARVTQFEARRYMNLNARDVRHPLVNWRSRATPTIAWLMNLAKDETVWSLAPTLQNLGG